MDYNSSDTIGKRIKFADRILQGIEPEYYPSSTGKIEVMECVVADIKIFSDVGNIIELKIVIKGGKIGYNSSNGKNDRSGDPI